MKAKFLLVALAMSSVAMFSSAKEQVTTENIGTLLTDGAVITLQCRDNNGGVDYYFNGPAVKTLPADFSYDNLYQVEAAENDAIYLKRLSNGKYVGKSGNAQNEVETAAAAAPFTTSFVTIANWGDMGSGTVNDGTCMLRFTTDGTFLNCKAKADTPGYATDTGGYSAWYVFAYTDEEVEALVPGTPDGKVVNLPGNLTTVTELTDGGYYLMFDHSKPNNGDSGSRAMRFFNSNQTYIQGNQNLNASSTGSVSYDEYVWQAIKDGEYWKFKNVGTGKYVEAAPTEKKPISLSNEAGLYSAEYFEAGEGFKLISSVSSQAWDGVGADQGYKMVTWGAQGGNNNKYHYYQFFEVTDGMVSEGYDVTLTLPYKNGQNLTVTLPSVAVDTEVSALFAQIPSYLGFEATGVEGEETTVTKANTAFTLQGSWSYLDKIGRMLSREGQSGRQYWKYTVDGNINAQDATNASALVPERLFRLNGSIENNELYVTIQNVAAGEDKYFTNVLDVEENESGNNTGVFETTAQKHKVVSNSTNTNGGFSLQNTDNANAHIQNYWGKDNVGYWISGSSQNDNSSYIQFFALTEDDWTAAANELSGMVGEGWGNYSIEADYEETYNGVIAKLEAMANVANPTFAQVTEALSVTVADVEEHLTLNQLTPGFYRFYGAKYLTSTPATATANAGRILMSNGLGDGNNGAETVVYVDADRRVVSLSNGLVLGKFAGSNDRKFVHKSSADAGTITIYRSSEAGKYNISLNNGGHYIYHSTVANEEAVVDRGGNTNGVAPAGAGYCWTIEPAQYIPVPVGDADHVTIYSPVPLENTNNRFELFTLTHNGEHAEIVKLEAEGNIEPNTVYYAKVNRNGVDAATKCSFLKVLDAAAQNETEGETETVAAPEINGSIYATEKAEGTSYYTIGVKNNAAHFLAHEGDYIPGFTAHIATAAPSTAVTNLGGYKLVTESEKTITGINEINAGAANGAKVIYDLQGRRVQRAAKGLYIINGVKTLVK